MDAVDVGGTSTDGCSAFTNAGAVAGRIALVERGLCGFALKARNASAAGAAGVVIYNNLANASAAPPGMADDGINGAFVTVPTVSVTRADGLAIVGQLGVGVTAIIGVDSTIRAGADASGRARVYAPFPVVGGSSISTPASGAGTAASRTRSVLSIRGPSRVGAASASRGSPRS